jgi:hypothetical protein
MGGSARLAAVLRCCTASQLDTEPWSCTGVVLMTLGEREDVRMDVRALVFGDGGIVSGWGSLKVDSDGEWLDCIHYVPLVAALRSSRSAYSVRLLGGDIGSLLGDRNDVGATVTGVWRDDAIEVRSVAVGPGPSPITPSISTPPCPPPLGGWRRGRVDENLEFDVGELLANGAAVRVATFRPSRDQAVLVVAATDVAAVESALRPRFDGRLCVVQSRWTRAQVDDVKQVLLGHMRDWMVDAVGSGAMSDSGQPMVNALLVRVTPAIAEWAETIDNDLLTLEPSIVPAGPASVDASSESRPVATD